MSASPEISTTEQFHLQPTIENPETSRFRELLDTSKQLIGRGALVLGLATASSVVVETGEAFLDPQSARASTTFANDYPNLDAAVHNLTNYDWWVDEDGDGQKDITDNNVTDNDETMSSRGYGYRNCTDGAAYWTAKYTGVNVAGWGNAMDWESGASAAGHTVYSGNTNSIEPGDIAQDEAPNPYGHVGFVSEVAKNPDGSVASVTVAELNRNAAGGYSLTTYASKNAAGNFTRNTAGADWDRFIDVNGAGKGLGNEDIAGGGGGGTPGPTFMPAMIQRPSGETDVAVVGPGNSMDMYYNAPSSTTWGVSHVAIPNWAYSTPSIAQRPSGETDIAVQGPGNSLDFYFNTQNSGAWDRVRAAGTGTTYGDPAMLQRPSGETNIAVQGPNNTLAFYYNAQNSPNWGGGVIPGSHAASKPAIIQRSSGEVDIVVQNPDNSMDFYYNPPNTNTWGVSHVAIAGWALSAPSVIQRPSGETDIAVQGPNNSLDFYINNPGSGGWSRIRAAAEGTTYNAPNPPVMLLRPSGEVDIAVQGPGNQASMYFNAQSSPNWGNSLAAVGSYSLRAPAMVQRPSTGETDMAIIGPNNRLDFYFNEQNSPYWSNIPIAGNNSAS